MPKDFATPDLQTSPAHDTFQLMFDSFDVFSTYWQPMLKNMGRWHLEMATLGAKQGQATLEYSQKVMRCASPAEAVNETMQYWQRLFDNAAEASQHMTVAAVKTAQQPAGFHFMGDKPATRPRDLIVVRDLEERDNGTAHHRRAA
jgi:hypothetical protein